ncbi:DUF4142 domain-containing protein [Pendulispora albinea]|uniref:DUF4142 domain-containing protein n=1 Tax=Pendulispora albinea TaxID=2741071 RepID=A0ABZ2M645_9BACT
MMNRRTKRIGPIAIFALAAATMAAGCHASTPESNVDTAPYRALAHDPRAMSDKLFVLGEYRIGMRERALADIVFQRTPDPELKEMAKVVRDGHQAGVERLRTIAAELEVTLPTRIAPDEQASIEAIGSLPPEQLVRVFLIRQRAMHAWDIAIFADYADVVVNDSLKRYVRETMIPLRQHADQIIRLANAKGIDGGFVTVGGRS